MNDQPNPNPQPGIESHERTPEPTPVSPRKILTGAVVVLLILAVFAVVGILRRMHAHTVLKDRTYNLAAPTVTVAPARPGAPVDTFVLPGNVTAYTDAPIYARTDGYLVRWYYDIGSKVEKGALLATVATLFFVPAFFSFIHGRIERGRQRESRRVSIGFDEFDETPE